MLIIGIIPPLVDRSVARSFGRLPVLAVASRDAESAYDRVRLFDRVRNLLHQSMCPYGTFVQRSLRAGQRWFRNGREAGRVVSQRLRRVSRGYSVGRSQHGERTGPGRAGRVTGGHRRGTRGLLGRSGLRLPSRCGDSWDSAGGGRPARSSSGALLGRWRLAGAACTFGVRGFSGGSAAGSFAAAQVAAAVVASLLSGVLRAACLGAEWAGPFPHDW